MTTFTVGSGWTLSSIAKKFGVTLSALMQANNITDANQIMAGTTLHIPNGSGGGGGGGDNVDLQTTKVHTGTNAADTISKPNSTDKWIIDSRDGNDTVSGGKSHDNIDGGGGIDTLNGNEGNDYLYGAYGADTLRGGAGADWLDGGPGADTLIGGDGGDYFIFAPDSGADIINDFYVGYIPGGNTGYDVMDFSGVNGITGYNDLINNHASVVNGEVVIIWGGGNSVTLKGVAAVSELTVYDFSF